MDHANGNDIYYTKGNDVKNSAKLRSLLIILVVIVAILTAVVLGLTIYLIVKVDDINNNQVTAQPQSTSTSLPTWPAPSNAPMGIYDEAATAADNGICSEIGRDILIHGGNAVDSSIAMLFCTGIMTAQSSGIGGGHFMTIYNRTTKSCVVIDAREVAPMAASQNMYENTTDGSQLGYLALGVPGQLAGLWTAYKHFGGGVPWSSLVEPSVKLCEEGYSVSSAMANALWNNIEYIMNSTSLQTYINNATGLPYRAGDLMTRPIFGQFLRKIAFADDPVQLFYNSSITKQLVQEITAGGGIITEDDFRNYRVKWGENERPVMVTQLKGNLRACGPPPPSSAAVASAILNIMDGYDITPDSLLTVDSNVEVYHRFIESMKFAYGDREQLGDMDFVPTALDLAMNLTTPQYGAYIRSKILDTAQNLSYYDGSFSYMNDHGTSHVSVIDSDGNAVSVTSTINLNFGAKVSSMSTGIIWNNDMDDFSQPNETNYFNYMPTPNNYIVPGKRPLSSMSPLVVYDINTGEVKQASGAAGGSRIISAVAYILMRTLYFNETIKDAQDSPRLHNQLQPFYTEYELGFPQVYLQGLEERGQDMEPYYTSGNSTAATAVVREINHGNSARPQFAANIAPLKQFTANSDYRKGGGFPSGY
jgi:gamma-glutamyltranspeptidase